VIEAWKKLTGRERRVLVGGGVLLAVIIGYLAVWGPLAQRHGLLQNRVAQQRQLLAWMHDAAQQVRQLREQSGTGMREPLQGSLLGTVDKSAKGAGLGPAVSRMEPQGDQAVRVTLEEAVFDQAIAWIGELQGRYGVHVVQLGLEKGDAGKVNMRVKFAL